MCLRFHWVTLPPKTWNLTGSPFKKKMVLQDRPVRFHVNWWEGTVKIRMVFRLVSLQTNLKSLPSESTNQNQELGSQKILLLACWKEQPQGDEEQLP